MVCVLSASGVRIESCAYRVVCVSCVSSGVCMVCERHSAQDTGQVQTKCCHCVCVFLLIALCASSKQRVTCNSVSMPLQSHAIPCVSVYTVCVCLYRLSVALCAWSNQSAT